VIFATGRAREGGQRGGKKIDAFAVFKTFLLPVML
jgi:hypothetical protein